jgi:hypothetical protein
MDREIEVLLDEYKQRIEQLESEIGRLTGRGKRTYQSLRMEDTKIRGKVADVSYDSANGALRFEVVK